MSKKVSTPLNGVPEQYGYGESHVVFPFQIARIEGKLLTLVESLGLRESQEKATKDLTRDIVQGLYRDTVYLPPNLSTIIINEKHALIESGAAMIGNPPQYDPPFN